MEFPEFGEYPDYLLVETQQQLTDCIAGLKIVRRVYVDTEATDLSPFTAIPLLLQVAVDDEDGPFAYVINLQAFTKTQLKPLWTELTKKLCVGHNLSYDYKLLKHHYGFKMAHVYDTQIAQQMLTAGDFDEKSAWLSHVSLAVVHERYLGTPLAKDERKTFISLVPTAGWHPTVSQVKYAAGDVLCLPKILTAQADSLKSQKLVRSFQLRMAALPPICDMELRGMLINQDAWRVWLVDQQRIKEEAEIALQALLTPYEWEYQKAQYLAAKQAFEDWEVMADIQLAKVRKDYEDGGYQEEGWGQYKIHGMYAWRESHPRPPRPKPPAEDFVINLKSHPQMMRAFAALGFNVESSDKETRAKLLQRSDLNETQREVLETYSRFTVAAHNISAFGENILSRIRETGRLHTQYNIHLAETGRMTSEKPNFQNFPRDAALRNCFLADPGGVVITADFKSQELAVSAALSGDPVMKADLAAGRDLYKELATKVFSVPLAQVTKEQRYQCKVALLGITYGLSVKGLEKNNQIPPALGTKIIREIRTRYKDLVAWSDGLVETATRERVVETAAGSKRYFRDLEMPSWKLATEARNAPVQGTAADIVYRVIARLSDALKAFPESYIANVVHDEMVVVCPASLSAQVSRTVQDEMSAGFNDILPESIYGVRCGADVHIAPYWTKD